MECVTISTLCSTEKILRREVQVEYVANFQVLVVVIGRFNQIVNNPDHLGADWSVVVISDWNHDIIQCKIIVMQICHMRNKHSPNFDVRRVQIIGVVHGQPTWMKELTGTIYGYDIWGVIEKIVNNGYFVVAPSVKNHSAAVFPFDSLV